MSDLHSDIFCTGCNQRFRQRGDGRHCPRCGELVPVPSLAHGPTLLWKSGPTEDEVPVLAAEDQEMRALVGRDLGVYRCE